MPTTELPKLAVGDSIAFSVGFGKERWNIEKINRVTPSGRLKTDTYELNPDLSIRGCDTYAQCYRGQIVTPEIREKVKRQNCIVRIGRSTLSELTTEQLTKIDAIIKGTV